MNSSYGRGGFSSLNQPPTSLLCVCAHPSSPQPRHGRQGVTLAKSIFSVYIAMTMFMLFTAKPCSAHFLFCTTSYFAWNQGCQVFPLFSVRSLFIPRLGLKGALLAVCTDTCTEGSASFPADTHPGHPLWWGLAALCTMSIGLRVLGAPLMSLCWVPVC